MALSQPFIFPRPMRPSRMFRHAGPFVIVLLAAVPSVHGKSGSDHPILASHITEERMNSQVPAPFYDVLRKTLKKRKTKIENICPGSDSVAQRVLEDYGAIFVARKV